MSASYPRPALRSAGFNPAVRHTGEDGGAVSGPFVVNVLAVDLARFAGTIGAALAADSIAGRETTSSIADRLHALAAVNGGFFVVNEAGGTPGDPAGISVIGGEVVSEAAAGPLSFCADVLTNVETEISVAIEGAAPIVADGLNRTPGRAMNCGNEGDVPIAPPAHDLLCSDADEIVVFTSAYGAPLPNGTGFQARFDAEGRLLETGPWLGGPRPTEGLRPSGYWWAGRRGRIGPR
ncbi:MAG: hypothetical protein GEU28_12055 [Dehalococcoidia bacterium]|nr:hypothetical protein [Dehalococcoidia bacterium]